jgi:hypothetical protein
LTTHFSSYRNENVLDWKDKYIFTIHSVIQE